MRLLPVILVLGCSSPAVEVDTGASVSDSGDPSLQWPVAGESLCGNPASLIQVAARLPEGTAPGTHDVVVALMHARHGDPQRGGHPHWLWRFKDQPLSAETPVFLEVDMCDGNAVMWSEENCEYVLVVTVDLDGNNGRTSPQLAIPDPGEWNATQIFDQSCHHPEPYRFELSLDCTEGPACVVFDGEVGCDCRTPACPSESGLCWL